MNDTNDENATSMDGEYKQNKENEANDEYRQDRTGQDNEDSVYESHPWQLMLLFWTWRICQKDSTPALSHTQMRDGICTSEPAQSNPTTTTTAPALACKHRTCRLLC